MDRRMEGWMDGRVMDRRTDGWMYGLHLGFVIGLRYKLVLAWGVGLSLGKC